MVAITPLDILKRTPKTNCGACGYPACLAFSAAVATVGVDPSTCPYIDVEGLATAAVPAGKETTDRDLALVEHLRGKIASYDFAGIADSLGCTCRTGRPEILFMAYLGRAVELGKESMRIDGLEPEDPRDQILIYNYVFSQGGRPPDGNWIGMESMPNSISKVRTLAEYSEKPLARCFGAMDAEDIADLAGKLGGRVDRAVSADIGLYIPVLPMIPLSVLYWKEEPEDGFEARVKVLFDHHVLDFLDIESLVFCTERLAERVAEIVGQRG